jgi:hypothetical protein
MPSKRIVADDVGRVGDTAGLLPVVSSRPRSAKILEY